MEFLSARQYHQSPMPEAPEAHFVMKPLWLLNFYTRSFPVFISFLHLPECENYRNHIISGTQKVSMLY
jgi:hypothetical protein